ncbi:interleukin-17 receptor E isoform X2 [Octodon degus]|uniref:Interleukin-17 receptor E n=1 Tax=Octodon degus TaxID=10160 RepID=A0A6P6DNT8_OCTDE|nr:interleukin-17 receptor E isoform X2 [Octodon degus]
MGSSRLAALLLAVFLLPTGLSPSADTGCGCLSHRITRCLLAFHMRKLLDSRVQSEKGLPISTPTLNVSRKRLRYRRTQPSDPGAVGSLRRGGPEFTFELLPVAQAIRVTIPLGPEVSVRLCHQWALECEELSSPFDAQKTVAGGHTEDLSYEFLLPCLCIEAAYLQKDTVRSKKCPFQNWPEAEAYAPNLWKSVHFTDHSQHNRMVMALTLHCPLKLEASLCQRQDQHSLCEDLPNATVQESEGWYVWEKVDLHPLLCFKFYFENSSHVECPHQSGSLPSWNVSAATQAQQLILHFSSRTSASFSATWSYPGLELDTAMSPVYSISQAQGPDPVTVDLIIPFLRPGGCILVWRTDVQFARKRLLCPSVSHRRLGLLTLVLLGLSIFLGVVLVLTCRRRRLLSGPAPSSGLGGAQPVLLLHAADSEAQRRLVGALAELLRAALGGGRDVIVDLWEGTRVAQVGPLPWLWAARARVARERGIVLLLWSPVGRSLTSESDPRTTPLRALLCAAPRPLLLLIYFSRLCAKGDIPRSLRALPRYRLLRDWPHLLGALGARPCPLATCGGLPGAGHLRSRLELCRQLELEAQRLELEAQLAR